MLRAPLLVPTVVLAALVSACASSQAVPRPFPGAPTPAGSGIPEPVSPPDPPPVAAPAPAAAADPVEPGTGLPVLVTAMALRGAPYRLGGSDPTGFDCSGFVQYVYAQHGQTLPRETRDQFRTGRPVAREEVQPGDLVFFETVSPGASHVGIALGRDEFVHAPSARGVVRVERYSTTYWARRWMGARRVAG